MDPRVGRDAGRMNHEAWGRALNFRPMTLEVARVIADTWKYPAPYDFYDATADAEDYAELISPDEWPDHFWRVQHVDELVAYFSADRHQDSGACEISLGLRPDLAGGGRGSVFLAAGLDQIRRWELPAHVVLSVAAFNTRAITVYEGAGFEITRRYPQSTNGGIYDFVSMELHLH